MFSIHCTMKYIIRMEYHCQNSRISNTVREFCNTRWLLHSPCRWDQWHRDTYHFVRVTTFHPTKSINVVYPRIFILAEFFFFLIIPRVIAIFCTRCIFHIQSFSLYKYPLSRQHINPLFLAARIRSTRNTNGHNNNKICVMAIHDCQLDD